MTDYTFTGGAGFPAGVVGSNEDLSNPDNYDPNGTPGAGDGVSFDTAAPVESGSLTVDTLSGGNFTDGTIEANSASGSVAEGGSTIFVNIITAGEALAGGTINASEEADGTLV
jgi:hypothetical protein